MPTDSPFTCVLDIRASLGECAQWNSAEQALYWVDINASLMSCAVRRGPGGSRGATVAP